jgi:hypothetical protein
MTLGDMTWYVLLCSVSGPFLFLPFLLLSANVGRLGEIESEGKQEQTMTTNETLTGSPA